MTHDDTTIQAAIDAAFKTNGENNHGSLVTNKYHVMWSREAPSRLAVAKAFLAALPPAEQPAPDERSLGQIAFEAFGYTHSWDVSTRQGDWQRAAQAVVEAVRGKQSAEIEKLKAELTQTQKHLVEANRGAQRNAHINQSLATKLNEAKATIEALKQAEANSAPAEAATLEAHGKTWIRHKQGDPMPCDGEAKVEWILEDELNGTRPFISGFIQAKDLGNWNGIIGWRYADKPEAEQKVDPYAELKAAKAAGKVIQTKWTNYNWTDNPSPDWTLPPERYRIKPEPASESAQSWQPAVGDVVRLIAEQNSSAVRFSEREMRIVDVALRMQQEYEQLFLEVKDLKKQLTNLKTQKP